MSLQSIAKCGIIERGNIYMKIFKKLKKELRNMPKVQIVKRGSRVNSSILGKRKLDYT